MAQVARWTGAELQSAIKDYSDASVVAEVADRAINADVLADASTTDEMVTAEATTRGVLVGLDTFNPSVATLDLDVDYSGSIEFANDAVTDVGGGSFVLSGPSAAHLALSADRSTIIRPGDAAYSLGVNVLAAGLGTTLDASLDVQSTMGAYSIPIIGTPPSWLPATLAGYVADWSATDIAGADGSSVTSWTSHLDPSLIATKSSGKGNGVLRTTSFGTGTKPGLDLYTNTSQFDLPAAVRTAVLAGTACEIWVVYKQRGAGGSSYTELCQTGTASGGGAGLYPLSDGSWYISFMNASQTSIGAVSSLTTPHTVRYTASGVSGASKTIRGYKNNTLIGSTTQTIATRATWTIGGDYTGQRVGGDIAHFIVFSAALSAGDATALQAFLVSQWGL